MILIQTYNEFVIRYCYLAYAEKARVDLHVKAQDHIF